MLPLIALSCPQCSAPLPRAARWRTVQCSYCGATVTLGGSPSVERAAFRDALMRQRAGQAAGRAFGWRGERYAVLAPLGAGRHSEVLLARRIGAPPRHVTAKLARDADGAAALARELEVLQSLQQLDAPGAAYFTQRLPQPIGLSLAQDDTGAEHMALLLRHPPGYWGSLAEVLPGHPEGIDPRHAVWLWRRMLEVLAFVHDCGWVHGDIAPEHALVHPRDHGVLLIGWARAHTPAQAERAVAQDLARSAWTVRTLLHGLHDGEPGTGARTPAPLAALLRQCSDPADAALRGGARGIEQALSAAARDAFGAPQFVHFDPAPRRGA